MASMMLVFRVPEGKQLEEAKSIPVSIFMKRLRSEPFPRYSLPKKDADESRKSSDDEGENDD
jgi:hypothetical protein